ncbi:hypothetical protein BUALT_Bualt05G0130400 [Buddleja alternifolia]|uniref:Uncharacterized protein n=1 Tax=Buddleja alternifolia TaxID=168488 RepID=A0AAV6XRJ6_9LAMI|nr:hypothetical protein BUALT_Bualt05G0130400 [Buddleja alternifolia]
MRSNEARDDIIKSSWPEGQWTTGFFDCGDDRSNCVKTCFCPCITMGQIIEIIDRGTTRQITAAVGGRGATPRRCKDERNGVPVARSSG